MKQDNLLLVIAIITVIVSASGAWFTYSTLDDFKQTWFTGFATSIATVNLTVESGAGINFTTNNINFGSGRVYQGANNATLSTVGSGTVINGNWTPVAGGLQLQNIGNVNISINLSSGKTASTFLGGTNPGYKYNVSANETGSCTNSSGGTQGKGVGNLSLFRDFVTGGGTLICENFLFADSSDTLRIDIYLDIPSDAVTGALGDVITATTIPA